MAENVLAYRYNSRIMYSDKNGSEDLGSMFIRYIIIENQYTTKPIPVIYISIALQPNIYSRIIDNENNGKIYLELNCYNALSNLYVAKNSFREEFNYIISTSDPAYTTPLDEGSKTPDDNYKIITLGLISNKLMNANKAEKDKNDGILISGVFGCIDTDTIISKIIEGVEKFNIHSVIKPPTHNNQFNQLVIPPMNNRKQIINYIFDKAPFYDTSFLYYMDFNNLYLVDMVPDGTIVNDDDLPRVIFRIHNIAEAVTFTEGMIIENNAYIIDVNPNRITILPNKVQDKVANNLVTIDEDGVMDVKEINVNASIGSEPKYTFKRGGNAQLYKNIFESTSVTVKIAKESLNGSLFTPNKRYSIMNYEAKPEYNGDYYLIQKREIIKNNMGVLRSSIEFTLCKIGNIEDIGNTFTDTKNIQSTDVTNSFEPSPRRVKIPAGGKGSAVVGSNVKVESEKPKKRMKFSAAGVELTNGGVITPKVVEEEVVPATEETEELTEAQWKLRTSKRAGADTVDKKFAGATRYVVTKDGQSLSRKFHK